MPSDQSTSGKERPDGWPEHYMGTPETHCTHYMMWDTAEERYVCIYGCGKTANEPPEGKIDRPVEAGTDRSEDENHD